MTINRTKTIMMILLVGSFMVAVPASYAGEAAKMSDTVHRKTMGGLHHPDQAGDAANKKSTMSDTVHRKTMGGLHHPDQEEDAAADKKATMSDTVHRKTMGGLHHPDK